LRKARIAIVEDEIILVRGLEEALERLEYTVCGFASSGEDAIELIEREKPDLALVDIFLRGAMDGIELARIVSDRFGIPVIYITAYSSSDVLERAKLTDPFGYIVKPFRDRQLKVSIELALERLRAERERTALLEKYRRTIEELELEIVGRSRELDETRKELESAVEEVGSQEVKLDQLRHELQELNKSLLTMSTQMARMRQDLEMEVAAAIRARILPILRQLENNTDSRRYRTEIEMLSLHMSHLSSSLAKEHTPSGALSCMELRIAALIKNDFTSEQIAQQLHLSPDTIKTHRRNIRKKLGIQNVSTTLSTFLKRRWIAARSH
jgi:DNA-binding NarL/FixJ family response regulator